MRIVYNKGTTPVDIQNMAMDSENRAIMAPTFENLDGLVCQQSMDKLDVTAGILNIFDIELTTEIRLAGGEYWIHPSGITCITDEDTVEFSIVDKNDVLGYFQYYGLVIGSGILELSKFVHNEYLLKGNSEEGFHTDLTKTKGTALVTSGLFKRVYVDSKGTENFTLYSKFIYYE